MARAEAAYSAGVAAKYNAFGEDIAGTMGRLQLLRNHLYGANGEINETIKKKVDDLNAHLRKIKRGESSTLPKKSQSLKPNLKLGIPFQQLQEAREADRQNRILQLSRNLEPDAPRPLLGGGAVAQQTGTLPRLPQQRIVDLLPNLRTPVVDRQFLADELVTTGSNVRTPLTAQALQESRDAQRAAVTAAQAREAQRLAADSDEALKLLQNIVKKVATRGR